MITQASVKPLKKKYLKTLYFVKILKEKLVLHLFLCFLLLVYVIFFLYCYIVTVQTTARKNKAMRAYPQAAVLSLNCVVHEKQKRNRSFMGLFDCLTALAPKPTIGVNVFGWHTALSACVLYQHFLCKERDRNRESLDM